MASKSDKKYIKKRSVVKKRNQKGGSVENPSYSAGGTGGGAGTFIDDVVGVITYSVAAIASSVETLGLIIDMPGDMGRAFSTTNPPTPADIK